VATRKCPYDHGSPEYAANWVAINREAFGNTEGLIHTDAHGGYYVAGRYEDVDWIARDKDSFSQERHEDADGNPTLGAFIPTTPNKLVPIETDPPLQAQIRRALNPAFTIKVAMRWKPVIRQIADTMIDRVIEQGHCDLVKDVTKAIPAIFNFRVLGVPLNRWEESIDAPGILHYAPPGSETYNNALAALERTRQDVIAAVEQRRATPRPDLMTVISQMSLDGVPISTDLIVDLVQALVSGGNGTTTGLMSHSLRYLGEHPEDRAWLQEDPSRIRLAVEEFLRFFSPVQTIARNAAQPVCVAGTDLEVGDRVLMSWAAANRDPDVFPDPDKVILDRPQNRHLAFGIGAHHCIGFNMARVMAATAIEAIIERLPDYEIQEEGVVAFEHIPVVHGLRSLPVTFTPGEKIGAEIPPESEDPELPQSVLDAIAEAAAENNRVQAEA